MEKHQITNEQLNNLIAFVKENTDLIEFKKQQLIQGFEKMKTMNVPDPLYSKDQVENWRLHRSKILKECFN